MTMLQRTIKLRVLAEHQMTTFLQATSTQRTDHVLMDVLQGTAMPRVVISCQTNLSPQATSAQWTDHCLMVVLQRTTRLRVVTRPQVVGSPITKSAYPCSRHPLQEGRSAEDLPNKRKVITIFGKSYKPENS